MKSSNVSMKMSSPTRPLISEGLLNSKSVAFMSIMSALGVVLAFLSVFSLPIGPGIAIDLSHVGTYIVALSGGPIMGSIAGAIVGLIPAFQFANPALIPGKVLTGFTVGFLYYISVSKINAVKRDNKWKITAMLVCGIIGYLPEMIFTIWDLFLIMGFPDAVIIEILIKAWIEIILISVLMSVVLNIKSVSHLVQDLVGEPGTIGRLEMLIFASIIDGSMLFLMLLFLPIDFYSNLWGWTFTSKTEFEYLMWIIGLAVVLAVLLVYIAYEIKKSREIVS